MSQLLERVRRYSAEHALWSAETRVVAAVSGGSDSVALLFLLHALASRGGCRLAGLVHLHHQIRGIEADRDAAFCHALAERLGVAAVMAQADVPALARSAGVSVEVAGRDARQRCYAEAAVTLGAACVAVAHTRDDQAETVLLRLARGAGAAGLSGIAPRRGHLVRPLLDVSRADLQAYLGEIGEGWREDATNADRGIPRNRIRHEVLPHLRVVNAQADAALTRAADILRVDAAFLDELANEAAARLVRLETATPLGPPRVTIAAGELGRLAPALRRRVAIRALETANPSRSYGLEEAQLLCEAAASGAAASLAGLTMERFGGDVVLVSRALSGGRESRRDRVAESQPPGRPGGAYALRLGIPGAVVAPHGRWTLSAEGPLPRRDAPAAAPDLVVVDASTLSEDLVVRPRRPGDRLQPLGAPGHRKVQDILVDRKIPRDDRDREPIVTDKIGRIIWVAGRVLAAPFRVTPLTMTVVVLTLRRQ